jgi:phage shock protein A
MELFDHLSRVARTNLNEMVSQSNNPEEALDRAISDIHEALVQTKQAIAKIESILYQQAQLNYTAALIEAGNWQQRAQEARERGDEKQEHQAIERLRIHQDNASKAKAQMAKQIEQADTLKENLTLLENKLAEAKIKRDMLKDQAVAKANEPLPSPIERLDPSDVDDELAAMKALLTASSVPRKLKGVLIIEKAIRDTRNTIAKAIAKQSQIHNQHIQAKTEIYTFHKQALQAVLDGDRASAMQALISEATQEKLVYELKTQLEHQEAVIDLLKQNLATLEEVKITVEKLTEVEQDEEEESLTSTPYNSVVNGELESLRKQLGNL